MLKTDDADLVELMESIGAMTRLNDDEVRQAWVELSQRGPNRGWSSRMAAIYLVTRLGRIGEHAQLTGAWNAVGDEYKNAFEAEAARRDPAAIRAQLETNTAVSEAARRVYFSQALQENPTQAVELWLRSTPPESLGDQAEWFGDALAQGGEAREKIMALLREKKGGNESFPWLISAMASDWMSRDPAAVEQWIAQPGQADIRDAVLSQLVAARGLANPEAAWQWSTVLPDNLRREAITFNAGELANHHPEVGKKLLAALEDPLDRTEAIKSFSSIHAANNYADWNTWRAALPPAERDTANESAFALWARNEPDQAVQWLGSRPPGEAKNAMVASLVHVVASENTDLAIQLIGNISDPKTRREAVTIALQSVSTSELDKIRAILAAAERPSAQGG